MYQRKVPCTIILIVLNAVIFLFLSFMGMTEDPGFLLRHGAMYVPYVLGDEEFYRLLTSMFLHFNFPHLVNNMLMLALLGQQLERVIGSVKYIILYLLSGLAGNIASGLYDLYTGSFAVSGGASGAVSGIIGALLYIAMRNHGRVGNVSGKGIVFMVVLSLFYGVTNADINNLAHIGGFAGGFVLSVLLYRKRRIQARPTGEDDGEYRA